MDCLQHYIKWKIPHAFFDLEQNREAAARFTEKGAVKAEPWCPFYVR